MERKEELKELRRRLRILEEEAEALPPWDEDYEDAWAQVDRMRDRVYGLEAKARKEERTA